MNILVFGAGVQGSYLANVLVQGGHDVTVLARGKRAEELEEKGVVIRHYVQRKTTFDPVRVIRTLEPGDLYDLIFVMMKYSDFGAVLPILANNESRNIILVGNNMDTYSMQDYLKAGRSPKQVAFGFQTTAGTRVDGQVICIRGGHGQMVIGGLNSPIPFRSLLEQAFKRTKYKLNYHNQIDAWLKNHMVLVVPMTMVILFHGFQMKQVVRDDKRLRQLVAAMGEGFHVLDSLGYPLTPVGQASWIIRYPRLVRCALKLFFSLPISRLIDGTDVELNALNYTFAELRTSSNVPTPNWDALEAERRIIQS
ncbi:ketopantoate reductase family protein [Paenibacillus caseinilyticus]|uniref:2-dehydropantoate 2-reductase n=1 Tax=Paenibacillus mucilaginosus K02 TaxID=997761 RepID=I0BE50_9BACL|nr:2-dehydropantoate 2-reductase N-terminal domain-containing protein [Paenibacillus mucilaginosus]AFH60647.2 2-dehydropantoate 2-reductase [Paenibacillus mucilaginosus K02]